MNFFMSYIKMSFIIFHLAARYNGILISFHILFCNIFKYFRFCRQWWSWGGTGCISCGSRWFIYFEVCLRYIPLITMPIIEEKIASNYQNRTSTIFLRQYLFYLSSKHNKVEFIGSINAKTNIMPNKFLIFVM